MRAFVGVRRAWFSLWTRGRCTDVREAKAASTQLFHGKVSYFPRRALTLALKPAPAYAPARALALAISLIRTHTRIRTHTDTRTRTTIALSYSYS